MTVENKYVDAAVAGGEVGAGFATQGRSVKCMRKTFEVAAADDDGSIYRLFKNVNPHIVPVKIDVANDAITNGTDYDLGLYETNGGVEVDKDVLADGLNLSSAHIHGAEISGMSAVNIDKAEKALFELAGKVIGALKGGFDICLTANTVGTVAGTITVSLWYIEQF